MYDYHVYAYVVHEEVPFAEATDDHGLMEDAKNVGRKAFRLTSRIWLKPNLLLG